MVFTDLPVELQNIYTTNVELFLKVIFVIFLSFICVRSIQKLKEKEKTPYFLVATIRAIIGLVSYGILFILPFFTMFLLYPQFNFGLVIQYVTIFYLIATIVVPVVILTNVFFFVPALLGKIIGYDPLSARTDKVQNDILQFGINLKYKANNIINKLRR